MWIMVTGRYSGPTAPERAANLAVLNAAALDIYRKGHIPLIGLLCALPLFGEDTTREDCHADVMRVSLAVAERCDAVYVVSHSRGADREIDLFREGRKPVFERLDDVPDA